MSRISNIISKIPDGIDAIVVMSELNCRYITGLAYTDGAAVVTRSKAYLVTDFRYIETAKTKESDELEVVQNSAGLFKTILSILGSEKAHTVGYDDANMTCEMFEKMKSAMPLFKFRPYGRILEELREVKDENEIESIRRAQLIAEKSLDELRKRVKPDMTECEVAAELEYLMRLNGSEKPSFDTIAVSGSASSLPHGVPRNVKLQKGFFTLDFGATYNGYDSDMTRTFAIGTPTERMKLVYGTVLKAQTEAIAALKAGITGAEADKIARDIINGAGFEGCFGHSLGHGVGLFIHEGPRLAQSYNDKLVSGNIVTIEPGIYLEGEFGVRIEDMAAITDDGCRNLTTYPKELEEL